VVVLDLGQVYAGPGSRHPVLRNRPKLNGGELDRLAAEGVI
jgi:hypothetical protein